MSSDLGLKKIIIQKASKEQYNLQRKLTVSAGKGAWAIKSKSFAIKQKPLHELVRVLIGMKLGYTSNFIIFVEREYLMQIVFGLEF